MGEPVTASFYGLPNVRRELDHLEDKRSFEYAACGSGR
jgi:hypothetical protein